MIGNRYISNRQRLKISSIVTLIFFTAFTIGAGRAEENGVQLKKSETNIAGIDVKMKPPEKEKKIQKEGDGKRVIQKTGEKKKKKSTMMLIFAGAVVAVMALFVLKKKKDDTTPELVLSTENVNVPEGGTATFNVRLSKEPVGTVSVRVERSSGDEDLVVQEGGLLTYTPSNWSANKTVTLAAGEDLDYDNDSAIIQVRADGMVTREVTAVEQDDDTPVSNATWEISPPSTTNGGGTWGSVLKMTADLDGNNLTLRVQKQSGTFSESHSVFLKVATYEAYGLNRATGTISVGESQWTHTHDLSQYQGGYPKEFYFRLESTTSGYSWVGPIKVGEINNK